MKLRRQISDTKPHYPPFSALKLLAVGSTLTAALALSCAKSEKKEAPAKPKGKKPKPMVKTGGVKDPPQNLPDKDKDGVPDVKDRCPNLKGLAAEEGCPKEPPVLPGKMARPGKPHGTTDTKPLDSDKDGVPDAKDRCPKVKGSKDNYGCPIRKKGLYVRPRNLGKLKILRPDSMSKIAPVTKPKGDIK